MENKVFKYVFIVFIIIILILTGYYIAKASKENAQEQTILKNVEELSPIQNDLRLAVAELDTMNPILSKNRNVYEYSKLFYSSLVTLNENYELEFDLAKSIERIDDLNYKITIRDDVFWQNNNGNLTSKDVKFTIEQIHKNDSLYDYNIEQIEAITVVDNYTIILKLKNKTPFFEYNLTFPIMKEVDSEFFKNKEQYNVPVCCGKYVLKESVNNTFVYTKNDGYYMDFNPSIINIIVTHYNTMGEVYNSFKSGNIDLVTTNEKNIEQYIGTNGYQVVGLKDMEFTFLAINNEKIINANVRKAIEKIISVEDIIPNLNGNYIKSTHPLDYGSHLFKNISLNASNDSDQKNRKEEGKNILKEEKFSDKVRILVNSENEFQNIVADKIFKDLNEAGVSVTLNKVKKDKYYEMINAKDYDFAVVTIKTTMTPNISRFMYNGNILNYNNNDANTIIEKAMLEPITEERNEKLEQYYEELEKIYVRDLPFIGLLRNTKIVILNTGVTTDGNLNMFNMFQNMEKWYRR